MFLIDAPEDCPLFHATWHAIGTLNGNKGKFVAIGGMVFTRPNGDKIYATIDTGGKHGEGISKGGAKFVGGVPVNAPALRVKFLRNLVLKPNLQNKEVISKLC